MPIEIRELIIKASISDQNQGAAQTGGDVPCDDDCLVAKCVDKVLQILADKNER